MSDRSLQEFLDECASIQGNLPFDWETDPASGEHLVSVSAKDGQKIIEGYACGNSRCLADYGGMYRVRCPVCGFDRRLQSPDKFMVPPPPEWVAHMEERRAAERGEIGPRRHGSVEQAIYDVRNNPDVEQTTLKKLGPSKWGRGRS